VPSTPVLQAVGVDEWAWRRGRRFGTIVVNLVDHRVVDLLPERSAATVAAWPTLERGNGVTEGQINRLKLLKRQGHGRAGFALLRQRMLLVA
jgi:transposase